MSSLWRTLQQQRWDDHRYYHHSRINQSLHLVSAVAFLCSYMLLFSNPVMAALLGWLVAMISRQLGHFVFEPKGYDAVNHATHEYKEEIKVGYNLRRKAVLLAIWALSPLALYLDPTLFGLYPPQPTPAEFLTHIGQIWFVLGISGLIFRSIQLFFIRDVQTGLVWAVKIVTDP